MTVPLKLCLKFADLQGCALQAALLGKQLPDLPSLHRDTATMEGIVTMYQDFMKKAGECLALPSCRAGGPVCLTATGTGVWSVIPEAVWVWLHPASALT